MSILGIYDGHNACAALISGTTGEVLAAVEEERFSRVKNHDGRLNEMAGPIQSALYCAERAVEPITHIALALASPEDLARDSINSFLESIKRGELTRLESAQAHGGDFYDLMQSPFLAQSRRVQSCLDTLAAAGINTNRATIHYVPHHVAHAASAFYTAPLEQALVVTLDGRGDCLSGSVSLGNGVALDPLMSLDALQSLGHLYSSFTVACGFQPMRHEGKLTALAASGNVDEELYSRLVDLYSFDDQRGTIVGGLNAGLPLGPYPDRLAKAHNERVMGIVADLDIRDAAATVQRFTEDIVTRLVRHHLEKTQSTSLAVAGGLFANVSLNLTLAKETQVDHLYVHPAMSDAGLALGAASYVYTKATRRRPLPLKHAFLGPDYDDEAVSTFRNAGFRVLDDMQPEDFLAECLAQGHTVARFIGRAEYGPRALGNRSILAPAGEANVTERLNSKLRRSAMMPFAPVVLAEDADTLFEGMDPIRWSAHFMTVAVKCRATMIRQAPAAVHCDQTARPQVVGVDNPRLERLLSRHRERAGVPVLINTSLNTHEDPMVLTPGDAAKTVIDAGIEVIQVGNTVCLSTSNLPFLRLKRGDRVPTTLLR